MDEAKFKDLASPYINVSHETFMRLQNYVELLLRWQDKINLIGPNTLQDIWTRHILDSVQLAPHIAKYSSIGDFGSGAGLPGLILSIVSGVHVMLVESDQRKAAFLLEAIRITKVNATVINHRVENVDQSLPFEAITARAFAPLPKLLEYCRPWLGSGATGIFLKGKDVEAEITSAAHDWQFDHRLYPSISDPGASILIVSTLQPR